MKTRLSEKTKSRLQKEQIPLDVLKHKVSHSNSEIERERTVDLCQKGKSVKDIKTISGETGKKLMMLRCINREEAMDGKDFIFSVHYIDPADNFTFDSVLIQKQFVDSGLEKNDENISDAKNVEMPSTVSSSITSNDTVHSRIPNERIKNGAKFKCRKETKLSPIKRRERKSVNSDSEKTDGNYESADIDDKLPVNSSANTDAQQEVKNKSVKTQSVANSIQEHEPVQLKEKDNMLVKKIQITTDDIARNKRESPITKQKRLKRNLKDEFADALRQSKGEKKLIIEVGCNDRLPRISDSTLSQDMNVCRSQNEKIDGVWPTQKISESPEDCTLNSGSALDSFSDKSASAECHTKGQDNRKDNSMKLLSSPKTSKKKKEIALETSSNDNLSSATGTVSAQGSTSDSCDVSLSNEDVSIPEKSSPKNTLSKRITTSDIGDCQEITNETELSESNTLVSKSCARELEKCNVETAHEEMDVDCCLQSTSSSTKTKNVPSALNSKKFSTKNKTKQQPDVKSVCSTSDEETLGKTRNVKVHCESDTQNLNRSNNPSLASLNETISKTNKERTEAHSSVSNQKKKSSTKRTVAESDDTFQRRITRSSLKNSNRFKIKR